MPYLSQDIRNIVRAVVEFQHERHNMLNMIEAREAHEERKGKERKEGKGTHMTGQLKETFTDRDSVTDPAAGDVMESKTGTWSEAKLSTDSTENKKSR